MNSVRHSDFKEASRLFYIAEGAALSDINDLISVWGIYFGTLKPQEFQETLLRDLPDSVRLELSDTGRLDVVSDKRDGQYIFCDERYLGSKYISAGSVCVHQDVQGLGYGSAWIRNLISLARKCKFSTCECNAEGLYGGHSWAGVFEPVIGAATRDRYAIPVQERLRLLLPYLSIQQSNALPNVDQFLEQTIPNRALMHEIASCAFDLAPVLDMMNFDASQSFMQSYDHKSDNKMATARERSLKADGTLHVGRFLTITTKWSGTLDIQSESSYGPALKKLENRVQRGKKRAREKGLVL